MYYYPHITNNEPKPWTSLESCAKLNRICNGWGDEASSKLPLTLCSSKSFNHPVEYSFQQGYSWGHWISRSFQKYIENIGILNKMNRFLKSI